MAKKLTPSPVNLGILVGLITCVPFGLFIHWLIPVFSITNVLILSAIWLFFVCVIFFGIMNLNKD